MVPDKILCRCRLLLPQDPGCCYHKSHHAGVEVAGAVVKALDPGGCSTGYDVASGAVSG